MNETKKTPKNYNCYDCYFKCCKLNEWNRHISTAKHKNRTELNKKSTNLMFTCKYCDKTYEARNSLWYHEKKCSSNNNTIEASEETETNHIIQDMSENQIEFIATMFKEVIKSNQDFQQQMLDLMKDNGNVTNNNTTNNKFNLNFFLNEQCKDAMNIMDFIKSMEITIEDFENIGTLGYAEGIGNLFISNLKTMEVVKRPIHCSDPKRETMYIKDKDAWENDKEKTLFISAIKNVAHQNFRKSIEWKEKNPDYKDSSSKTMDKYNKIINEAMGPQTKEEKERDYNKIMRRVAKEVTIDKK